MTLIKSISGMRGTIGGTAGENLTAIDIVTMTAAYATVLLESSHRPSVVIGRDGRISGHLVQSLVTSTLQSMGVDVLDVGLSTTPTVEMEVVHQKASGGIIITASHNPKEWNALKFLNARGEFISAETGARLLEIAQKGQTHFAEIDNLGTHSKIEGSIDRHIAAILKAPHVRKEGIRLKKYKIVVDCINSTGGIAMKPLLEELNCEVILLNDENMGHFVHNPEPLEYHLDQLKVAVIHHKADMGIAVDPDVDRLAFVDNNGNYCGEEYTLVMVSDWILSLTPGNTVSNLSSTILLRKITEQRGGEYRAGAVGEVNVVNKMKEINAVIGGEGNGGVIYPALHYGRDAMVGVALILSALAIKDMSLSEYRGSFANYFIVKDKIQLDHNTDVDALLSKLQDGFATHEIDTTDGVKIYFENGWAHMRKSNTEPIIRLYAEGPSLEEAKNIVKTVNSHLN